MPKGGWNVGVGIERGGASPSSRYSKGLDSIVNETYNSNMTNYKSIKGFTLAEVLITLGIIGIVAALTIPTLVSNYQEKQTVVKLNTTYNIIHEALRLMVVEEGTVDKWGSDSFERMEKLKEMLPKYVKIDKFCTTYEEGCKARYYKDRFTNTNLGEWANSNLDGRGVSLFRLSNGASVHIHPSSASHCNRDMSLAKRYGSDKTDCGYMRIDVNASSGPNVYDKDTFLFFILRDGILPAGSGRETVWASSFDAMCLGNDLRGNSGNGTCAGWVIYNKNMDYLHCPEKLGWDKSKSCKN